MLRKTTFVLVLAVLAACGHARVIQRTPNGGTIVLEGDKSKAMQGARGEMNAHCGARGYTVVLEGEEVVGSEPAQTVDGATTTTDVKEWRIHYECNLGAQRVSGPPGASS